MDSLGLGMSLFSVLPCWVSYPGTRRLATGGLNLRSGFSRYRSPPVPITAPGISRRPCLRRAALRGCGGDELQPGEIAHDFDDVDIPLQTLLRWEDEARRIVRLKRLADFKKGERHSFAVAWNPAEAHWLRLQIMQDHGIFLVEVRHLKDIRRFSQALMGDTQYLLNLEGRKASAREIQTRVPPEVVAGAGVVDPESMSWLCDLAGKRRESRLYCDADFALNHLSSSERDKISGISFRDAWAGQDFDEIGNVVSAIQASQGGLRPAFLCIPMLIQGEVNGLEKALEQLLQLRIEICFRVGFS
mmetsp:Transcript_16443/g.33535  ORF Transcript_16443/g.33535 Transcript_16443/m.33535 type:complete len:302 (-) Transcript_16443:479-1384(-)